MIRATVFSASPLMRVAEDARDRIPPSQSDVDPGQRDAWVAVVFATAAVEAFLNDLTEHVDVAAKSTHDPDLALLAKVLTDLERRRANAELKLDFLQLVITREAPKPGQPLQQEFAGLVKLRDQIIHAKPDKSLAWTLDGEDIAEEHNLRRQLQAWRLVGPERAVFTEEAATRATARWACRVARERVASIKPLLATGVYSKYFDPVFQGFVSE